MYLYYAKVELRGKLEPENFMSTFFVKETLIKMIHL